MVFSGDELGVCNGWLRSTRECYVVRLFNLERPNSRGHGLSGAGELPGADRGEMSCGDWLWPAVVREVLCQTDHEESRQPRRLWDWLSTRAYPASERTVDQPWESLRMGRMYSGWTTRLVRRARRDGSESAVSAARRESRQSPWKLRFRQRNLGPTAPGVSRGNHRCWA